MTFLRFCAVGTLGFLVDAAITLAMTEVIQSGPTTGRIVAFIVAATVTWHLNRRYTFRSSAKASWLPYLTFTALGALINVGVYLIWIHVLGAAPMQIVLGIACGSIAALSFNFLVSRHVVFRAR
ncbi:MAG: GtrA family protein [Burkholderiales bacterium]|nr:GtrA family protein [Burkholderiales bacterium]